MFKLRKKKKIIVKKFYKNEEIEKIFANGSFQFAIESLQKIMHLKPKESFFFSPANIYNILCIIYFGSVGSTEKSLKKILYLEDIPKTNLAQYYTNQQHCLNILADEEYKKYILSDDRNETNCWIKNTKFLNEAIQHLLKLEIVPFDKPDNLLTRINTVLRYLMKNYSYESVQIDNITETMEIILASILCHKGKKYLPIYENVSKKFFSYRPKKQRTLLSTKIGALINDYPYDVPYDKIMSTILIFPATLSEANRLVLTEDVSSLVETLTTKEGMNELRRMLHSKKSDLNKNLVNLCFQFANKLPIEELLIVLGVQELLIPDEPHLQQFVFEGEPIHFGGALHYAHIKMTPTDGTIASAATVFFNEKMDFEPMKEFDHSGFKHSFILLIYNKRSQKILFIGIMNKALRSKISNNNINNNLFNNKKQKQKGRYPTPNRFF